MYSNNQMYNFVKNFVKNNSNNKTEVLILTKFGIETILKHKCSAEDCFLYPIENPEHNYRHYNNEIYWKMKDNSLYFEVAEKNLYGVIDKISLLEFDGKKFTSIEYLPNQKSAMPLTAYKAIYDLNKQYDKFLCENMEL